MCGIAVIISPNEEKEEISPMLNEISNRGDSAPIFKKFHESLIGIVRLRIVDIKNGEQPFYNEDKTIGVVFNGEIYNYKALKNELMPKHTFKTDCDSEIMPHLYEEYGMDFIP